MKSVWIGLILAAVALSGCGNKDAKGSSAGTPNLETTAIQHNAAECPAWAGQFVNPNNRSERKSLRINGRQANRQVLIEDQYAYELTGKTIRYKGNNIYAAGCMGGRVVVQHGYQTSNGTLKTTATTTYTSLAEGRVLITRRFFDSDSPGWERTWEAARPAVPQRPPVHRPGRR